MPAQQRRIPVIAADGRPLNPCHPKRAASLVKAGKASFRHRYSLPYIKLNKSPEIDQHHDKRPISINVNPGAKLTGIALTQDDEHGNRSVLWTAVIEHRGNSIKRSMRKRSQNRRNRRARLRHRKPRFQHRKRPVGWLAPSIQSRLDNTLTWMNRLRNLFPLAEVRAETMQFDIRRLIARTVNGIEYQQGPLYRTTLRAAVLHRDGNNCFYCGRSGRSTPLEMEHIIPASLGGTGRIDNIVPSCVPCNRRKGNRPVEEFLKRRPAKLAQLNERLSVNPQSAAHLNVILPNLLKQLRATSLTVTEHDAAAVAAARKTLGLDKSEHADAAVLGPPNLSPVPYLNLPDHRYWERGTAAAPA